METSRKNWIAFEHYAQNILLEERKFLFFSYVKNEFGGPYLKVGMYKEGDVFFIYSHTWDRILDSNIHAEKLKQELFNPRGIIPTIIRFEKKVSKAHIDKYMDLINGISIKPPSFPRYLILDGHQHILNFGSPSSGQVTITWQGNTSDMKYVGEIISFIESLLVAD